MTGASDRPKVFGLGLNKTGTGTLGLALTFLGYRTKGWDPRVFNHFVEKRYNELDNVISRHDAFHDWPWPLLSEDLIDVHGRDALFVLTKRRSAEEWFDSLARHANRAAPSVRVRKLIYGYEHPLQNPAHHLDFYGSHLVNVRGLVRRYGIEERFLEVCWSDDDPWSTLCEFLGVNVPNKKFPHENKSG